MSGPLSGRLVLSLASVGPAARAARWLADYGADVVEIGPLNVGDRIEPAFHAYAAHRGMRRVQIDLRDSAGVAVLLELARRADVLLESFRPGVLKRRGLGYELVRQHNRRLVYCSTTGYGQDDARSGWAGHELNYLAATGYLACAEPTEHGGPGLPGATVADSAGGGMHAVMAILAALLARENTGEGQYLDVSITGGALAVMGIAVDEYLATGVEPKPAHGMLTGAFACYGCYPAGDGKWLSVAAIEPKFWANLCRALGLARWIDRQTERGVQQQIRAELRAVFASKSRDEWVAMLAPADTCVSPIWTVRETVDDASARGLVHTRRHPHHGMVRQLDPTLAGTPEPEDELPDWLTTDTDDVLAEAGYSADDISELRARKVVA